MCDVFRLSGGDRIAELLRKHVFPDGAKMNRLTPSFFRAAANISFWLMITAIIGYYLQGLNEGRWWTKEYMLSLSFPFAIMILASWVMFVPRFFEYDERTLVIHFWFRGKQNRLWEELSYYGGAFNVFLIQFGSMQALQILSVAYPRHEWRKFKAFLEARFPDKKASGWIGPFGFKWKRKHSGSDRRE